MEFLFVIFVAKMFQIRHKVQIFVSISYFVILSCILVTKSDCIPIFWLSKTKPERFFKIRGTTHTVWSSQKTPIFCPLEYSLSSPFISTYTSYLFSTFFFISFHCIWVVMQKAFCPVRYLMLLQDTTCLCCNCFLFRT
jgi:hypothetical protein